ncbi:MAG: hypothetical protein CL912_06965 [Deltaproteobacteria bacterium]|nr:hypothetical protein [Deltaproteobacteria bacterium]
MRGPKKKKSVVENAVPLKQTLSAPEGKQLTFRQINSLISTRPATEFCSRKLGVACQKGRKETIGEMVSASEHLHRSKSLRVRDYVDPFFRSSVTDPVASWLFQNNGRSREAGDSVETFIV